MNSLLLIAVLFISQGTARHVIQPGSAKQATGETATVVDVEEMPSILEVNKGIKNLKEGDIQPPTADTRNTINDIYAASFWTNKNIPIVYGTGTSMLTKAAVDEARREYELRTCLSLPLRTNEDNYITVRVLGGCFSSVGMIGGNQILSIGIGCEQMSTVVHEFMHAFGVWHEQSRADRDDYIEINYDAIDPELAYNFDNYGFNETDDRRVSYDFDSVMHYDKTAFSIDGNSTIITRDPEFQDVIGQRSGFSVGDVTKLSRMYGCSQPLRVTNHEEFETEAVGGYTSVGLNGNVEWLRHVLGESATDGPTTKYLPTYDASYSVPGEGSFLYMDTSRGFPGQSAWIKSMRYTTNVARQCLEFSYYLRLNVGSTIKFYVFLAEIDDVTGDIIDYNAPLWSHTTSTLAGPEFWRVQRMTISATRAYRLVFYGVTGQHYNDVIAIDDVSVIDKECDTGYFLVPEYSNLMATYLPDEYYQSPIMYTGSPGYAFQVLVYPNGWQSSIDSGFPGYMSMYFRLIGGIYDDQLEWPFDQQFIRFVITDQGPNPTERMNYFYNFLTDSSSATLGASWQKPAGLGSTNTAVGYRTFFYNERFYTRKYLKSGVAYFSVQVTDMRNYNESDGSSAQRNPLLIKPEQRMSGEPINWPTEVKSQPFSIDNDDNGEDQHEHDHQEHHEGHDEHEHEHQHEDEGEGVPPGMMSIKSGLLMVFVTSGVVFFVMAILTCVVARSFKGKQKTAPAVMTDVRFGPGLSKQSNAKYYDRREIL